MLKKFLSVSFGTVFLAASLSICPCPASAASAQEIQITKSHQCCPQTGASHCPESRCEHKQIKSPVSHAVNFGAAPFFSSLSFLPAVSLQESTVLKIEKAPPGAVFDSPAKFQSPPDLCIQLSSFLI